MDSVAAKVRKVMSECVRVREYLLVRPEVRAKPKLRSSRRNPTRAEASRSIHYFAEAGGLTEEEKWVLDARTVGFLTPLIPLAAKRIGDQSPR
jgi:hypothetical protein